MSANLESTGNRQSRVSEKSTMIDKKIEELFVAIESLEGRTERILMPISPTYTAEKEKLVLMNDIMETTQQLVPLAEELDSYGRKLNEALRRIASIRERCEL